MCEEESRRQQNVYYMAATTQQAETGSQGYNSMNTRIVHVPTQRLYMEPAWANGAFKACSDIVNCEWGQETTYSRPRLDKGRAQPLHMTDAYLVADRHLLGGDHPSAQSSRPDHRLNKQNCARNSFDGNSKPQLAPEGASRTLSKHCECACRL